MAECDKCMDALQKCEECEETLIAEEDLAKQIKHCAGASTGKGLTKNVKCPAADEAARHGLVK